MDSSTCEAINSIINVETLKCYQPTEHNLAFAFYIAFKNFNPENFTKEVHMNATETLKNMIFNQKQIYNSLGQERDDLKSALIVKETESKQNNELSKKEIEEYKDKIEELKFELQSERLKTEMNKKLLGKISKILEKYDPSPDDEEYETLPKKKTNNIIMKTLISNNKVA